MVLNDEVLIVGDGSKKIILLLATLLQEVYSSV